MADSRQGGGLKFGYIVGSDQNEKLILPHSKQEINVVGATDIHELRTRDPHDYDLLHISKSYFRQAGRHRLSDFACLLNTVTDCDSNPKVLENVRKALKGYGGRVINPPDRVARTSRDQIAKALASVPGIVVPKVVRIPKNKPAMLRRAADSGAIRFPAIIRIAGTHSGKVLGVCGSLEEAEAIIPKNQECFATEFVDYRSNDGIFRKYRVFVIGQELIFRHIAFADHWNVHAGDRERFIQAHPGAVAEWRRWCEQGLTLLPDGVTRSLHAIRDRIGLDFFGIDFGINEAGEAVLFEANATMSFFPFPTNPEYAFASACLPAAQDAFNRMLYAQMPSPSDVGAR
jgi:glutathione synthase/RimK-type ligase-like ATP-grasp enzyme